MRKVLIAVLLLLFVPSAFAETGYTQIDQETAKSMMTAKDGHIIVDVRRQDEFDSGHIPGAICIPNESIGCDSPEDLPDYDQIILVYCRSGRRSKEAAQKLVGMGYSNVYEFGGIIDWTGDIVTTEEETAPKTAILSFSSFSGGGYEYTVTAEDPSIVSCESRYEYEPHAEEIDGASFDYIVSLTGLKPGETTVTVYGESPIAESENSVYAVAVDEKLQVTLSPVRALSYFYVYRNGEINYDSYQITMDADGYHVSINEDEAKPVSIDAVNALMKVIDTYDVASWDGFSESKSFVLDGEGFWLDFNLTDGTRVHASGDNAFPDHYFAAMGEIWDILIRIIGEGSEMKLHIGETEVPVTWEDNDSVEELKALLPLTVQMSMYGGFEQVGSIGRSITRNDKQTITSSGDIVLYSGNQIVVFYGSNTWAYTMLGHVNLSQQEMTDLLIHGNVTITITGE